MVNSRSPKRHWIDDYLSVPYVDCGRDLKGLDCWGLVRHVLHHQFNLPLFESFGHVQPDNKRDLTQAFKHQVKSFSLSRPKPGAVAAGFRGKLLLHIGVCIEVNGQTQVLEISKKHGVSINQVRDFKRHYSKAEFYSYDCNSESLPI